MVHDMRGVHVVTTSRTYKGKTYKSHLLRRSFREHGKVRKETVANLSSLGDQIVELIRRALRGEQLLSPSALFEKSRTLLHGHVLAVLTAIERVGLDTLISAKSCRERSLVLAMIVARLLEADSKLGATRWFKDTTLPQLLNLGEVDEDDLYAAMDWLLERQRRIEKKLSARHLKGGDLVLYDLTSSYFEGDKCPLAELGHNRDGKKGKLQVNYGMLADRGGRPISVSVFSGSTSDSTTLLGQVEKARAEFGLESLVLVGDRGMITGKQISALKEIAGCGWVTALRSEAIRKLVEGGAIQLGLFDERNLFEIVHEDYPGERLVACRNPELAKLRTHKRESLIAATKKELEKVRGMAGKGKLKSAAAIGVRVGKVVNKYKVAKHLELDVREDGFDFAVDERSVAAEAALDGIYVVRTSLPPQSMEASEAVRTYKSLSAVERTFRSLKSIDLLVRPIRHWTEERVRAHIFLCLLAHYVEWHMAEAWRGLLFSDEDQEAKRTRDPVAPARRSRDALLKAATRETGDGNEVHSLRTLLHHLSTITRDVCRCFGGGEATFTVDTTPTPYQRRALDLLKEIRV